MTTPHAYGAYHWRQSAKNGRAVADIPSSYHYERFPIREIFDGGLKRWLLGLPAGAKVLIRPQDCVPGKNALPDNHGLPGVYDANKKCFIPNYNAPEYLTLLIATLKTIHDMTAKHLVLIEASWGFYGECSLYKSSAAAEKMRPTDASRRAILNAYITVFGVQRVAAFINDLTMRSALVAAGNNVIRADNLGLIGENNENDFEKRWAKPEDAAFLDGCILITERGHEDASRVNANWAEDSVIKHPNIVAVGNDVPANSTLAQIETWKRIFTIVNERAAPPSVDDQLAAALQQIAVLESTVKSLTADNKQLATDLNDMQSIISVVTTDYERLKLKVEQAREVLA